MDRAGAEGQAPHQQPVCHDLRLTVSEGPANDREIARLMREQGFTPGFTPPKARKKRDDEESRNQRELMKWWKFACRGLGVPEILLLSIPNGGGRSGPIVGAILKAEGLRKGAPDLFLAVPQRFRIKLAILYGPDAGKPVSPPVQFHGLFIEMKTATGALSPEQEVFHSLLQKQGYQVNVCRGWEQARDVILSYLKP